ncbi:MAG: hemin receptor [Anaerolineae bacterium]|nr:hemin receptor [Anaerolineae bacterium]
MRQPIMDFVQIALVQESWYKLTGRLDTLGTLFYWRLFDLDPSLRPLFSQNLHRQQQKFTNTLSFIVTHLDQPQQFFHSTKLLGRHHASKGVQPAHYHTVAQALLWSLQQLLGDQFTPAHCTAWETAYYLIAGLMKEAAASQ